MQRAHAASELNCVHALHKLIFNPRVVEGAAAVVWRQTGVTESLHLSCTFPTKLWTRRLLARSRRARMKEKNNRKEVQESRSEALPKLVGSPFVSGVLRRWVSTGMWRHISIPHTGNAPHLSHGKTNKGTQARNLLIMTVLLTRTCWRTERGHIFNFRETSRTIKRQPDIAQAHRLRGSSSLFPRLLPGVCSSPLGEILHLCQRSRGGGPARV